MPGSSLELWAGGGFVFCGLVVVALLFERLVDAVVQWRLDRRWKATKQANPQYQEWLERLKRGD